MFLLFISFCKVAAQQATVFSDDFATTTGATLTTVPGAIGASPRWNLTRSGADFGAAINTGLLTLSNDATTGANADGWAIGATATTNFLTPYSTTLGSNPGDVTWTFNMRQSRSNPSGLGGANYGMAFILAGTTGTSSSIGTGYAVTLGNSGKTDPLRLVRYNAGLQSSTTLITSTTVGLTDFGNTYLSVKVIYTPSTNTWQLFVRNDGVSFINPTSGSLTLQGNTVNTTYTGSVLPLLGGFWNASNRSNQTAYFDNVNVTVAIPSITSIAPPSKIAGSLAFTLTVNGTNFINGTSVVRWNGIARTTTFVNATQVTAAIPASDILSAGSASVTVANGVAVSNAQTFTIDPAGVPNISVSTSALTTMTTTTGTASTARTYTVSGSNLTANVVIAAPANFEVSTTGTTYFDSVTLPQTAGNLTGQPVTVYARVKATTLSGIYTGNLNHTTTGGASKTVAVTTTVLALKPTVQATGVTFTTVTSTTFTVNWINGNGANHLLLLRSGSAVNSNPVDGVTYTSIASFGAGSEVGIGNYAIFSGTGSSVAISGLQPNTTYHVAVYDYNGNSGTENYLTTSPAIGNRTTLNAPVGWQIYNTNITNTITFDTTVDGVNEGGFQAAGLSPSLSNGELNSNAWAITGFSDGAIGFAGISTDGQDYDRGASLGDVTVGGVYAFETSTNNVSLGIRPATNDFAPGSVSLRFQNQTGAAVTSLSIGYKVYIYNDQAASSSFNFSHSGDNAAYTSVSGLNVISPAAADATPGWKAYYRVVTLTGLNVANNNYYYFRWSGATVSGTTEFDSFGLDDLVLVANPTTTFATFAGTAENFVVLGNATLSGATTVTNDLTFNVGKLDINGATLTLNGTVTNTTSEGLKGSITSNLTLSGAQNPSLSFDQTTMGTTNLLNNLSVITTASNTVTILNPLVVNGTLTTAMGETLNLGTTALTGTLTGIVNNGTIATQNTTSLPIPSGKTWNGNGRIHYNASAAPQTVVVGTYLNLTSSSSGGATAAGNFNVNGILNLPTSNPSSTTGSLSMANHTVTMGGNATNTGIGDVTGIVTRNSILPNVTYTFGSANTSILFPNIGTLPSSLSLKIAIGAAPSWRTGAINRINDFIQTGGSGTKAVIKVRYLDSELNGNIESRLVNWAHIVSSATTLEQGRSNYNITDNWIELTNVNVGLYFTGTFGQVFTTLDEYAASSLTWNGSVSDSWTTATNWTPNATPSDLTVVYIPNATTTPNDPILNPSVLLGTLYIEAGGILNAPANSQFTINNGAGAWINNGTYNPGTGTSRVIFTNADATIAGVTNFNNLTIQTGCSLRPLSGNIMRIAGNFIINGALLSGIMSNTVEFTTINQIIPIPNGPSLNAYNNLIINGSGAVFPTSLNIAGNFTINQPIDFSSKTIFMKGFGLQTISGTSSPLFNNLVINNSSEGVILGTNASLIGTLTLSSGNFNLGDHNLTLGVNPVSGTFSSSNMIIASGSGQLRRAYNTAGSYTFPIGDSTEGLEYSPITIDVTAGTFSSAYVGVTVTDAIHPNNSSISNNLSRYWNVTQSGISAAVATVTASYTVLDIMGVENDIAGAQLKGVFNQLTNPWIKYNALTANTLTAFGATLAAGQTSAFTGIKGAAFTASLSGHGSFCLNDIVTLTAITLGGDAPYTYSWSGGLGTGETAVPPSTTVGTINYTVTIKDSNGITATDAANVVIIPASVGGTLTNNQSICSGSLPADLTVSGYTGSIIRWEQSSDALFTIHTPILTVSNILQGFAIGPLTSTSYFRAVLQNGSCTEAYSSVAIITIASTTWNGSAWSDGIPSIVKSVVFSGNYTAVADFSACNVTVANNAVISVASGVNITINNALTVSSGSFTLENNANLLQNGTANINSGNIIVKRSTSPLMRLDYALWASPVSDNNQFTLQSFSPNTLSNRFYTYNSDTNIYNLITSSSLFTAGQGYLIRLPNNHPIVPTIWTGSFSGKPNNGTLNISVVNNKFVAVGNPYPSTLDADQFMVDNGVNELYFWRKSNNLDQANSPSTSYATYTYAGGTGTFPNTAGGSSITPNGTVQVGQGFIVKTTSTNLVFNNGQRIAENQNQFLRSTSTTPIERHRIWLRINNGTNFFSQTMIAYMTGATQEVDDKIDGIYINDSPNAITSMINGAEYTIQGRSLPFDTGDIVPLGFKISVAGTYTISIDHVDGLFLGSQDIFLRDTQTGIVQEIKSGSYTFTTAAGIFNNRFEIIYTNTLGVETPAFSDSTVIVYPQGDNLMINTGILQMQTVKIYDIRGRLLVSREGINASTVAIPSNFANGVLLVQVISLDGIVVIKKVVW